MLVPVQPPLCIARASPTSLLFDELSPASIKLLDIIDAERMEIDLKKRHTPLRPHAQVRHTTNARTASEEPTLRHGMNSASVCGKLPPIIQGLLTNRATQPTVAAFNVNHRCNVRRSAHLHSTLPLLPAHELDMLTYCLAHSAHKSDVSLGRLNPLKPRRASKFTVKVTHLSRPSQVPVKSFHL